MLKMPVCCLPTHCECFRPAGRGGSVISSKRTTLLDVVPSSNPDSQESVDEAALLELTGLVAGSDGAKGGLEEDFDVEDLTKYTGHTAVLGLHKERFFIMNFN